MSLTNNLLQQYTQGTVWQGNVKTIGFAFTLLSVILLTYGCGYVPPPAPHTDVTTTTPLEQRLTAVYTPHKTIDVWLDDTSIYPREYFTEAKNALADALDQSVQVNSGGLVVFINIITGNSWNPANTLLTIVVPALGPDPLPPTLQAQPTPTGDPFTDAQAAKQVSNANAHALSQYQTTLRAHHALLARIRAQVHTLTNKLRALNPAIDSSGDVDVSGMFGRASQRLNAGKSMRLLIIASSLEQNTWQQFAPYETLWGVHVRVLWEYCLNAPECIQNNTFWRGAFLHAGAAPDVKIDDPGQSEALQTNLLV